LNSSVGVEAAVEAAEEDPQEAQHDSGLDVAGEDERTTRALQ
jgi:hypothetical protein